MTDVTNASRTLLYDLYNLDWNEKILNYFSISRSSLPTVKPSLSIFAHKTNIFGEVPLSSVLGDQQASLFGHNGFLKGSIKNTCLLYTSPSPRDGLLSRMPSSA